jgi:hypothetical protein
LTVYLSAGSGEIVGCVKLGVLFLLCAKVATPRHPLADKLYRDAARKLSGASFDPGPAFQNPFHDGHRKKELCGT